jgi:hypothetical protein
VALSGRDRSRYARHLLLTQLGEAGQERLLAAQVRADGDADPGALEVARCYLSRAGVSVCSFEAEQTGRIDDEPARAEANDKPAPDRAEWPLHVATADEVDAMAGVPALHEAARALAGALSAVGALLSALGLSGSTLSGAPVKPQIIFAISSEEA